VYSAVATTIAIGLLYTFLGTPASGGAVEAITRLVCLTALAGAVCGWMAGRSLQPWSWPKFIGVFVLCSVAVLFLTAYGKISTSHAGEKSTEIAKP
jgi:ABC-type uncharacterized transport system permease subunit